MLNNEIEKIKTEKSDEINKLQNHINKLNYKLNELEAERVGLKHSIQDKDSLIESLKNDLNMKNDEYIIAEKKWNSQNERLLNEQKSLEIKCKDLVQAKIMLDSSIKELETEKAQLEDKLSGYKNPTQTQSIKNITTNLYIKRNKIEDSPRNCNNINDFAENIATNLESTGIKDIDNVVANYIIGILAANMSPLICGYKAREIAAAISISYSGETPYIISLPNGYTNSKELLEIFNLAETNVVLIEDAVGTMNENALMPLLREKSEKGFSKKLLLLSTENLDSVKYMPTNLLNHVALVKINKYRANKKTGFEISDSREVLEQFIVLNSFKYESRIIKRLLHGLNFDSPYEMLRAIIVAYSSKLSNSKADLRGYLRSELMFICKCNNTVDVLEENIQKYQLDKNLMKIIRGGSK
ncbi:MAG TPA: hypothetical protein GX527_03925 [Clostridiaceae bacterium]|nr:hypothetical protein [Clostridiaceae bacterium]